MLQPKSGAILEQNNKIGEGPQWSNWKEEETSLFYRIGLHSWTTLPSFSTSAALLDTASTSTVLDS